MLSVDAHRSIFINILREIYTDPLLRTILGFKGGTAAMLFYDLPRFSVDLDFDLLEPDRKVAVFQRLEKILPRFGVLADATDKQFTLFFLLNYQKGQRNLKIEISKRPVKSKFVLKNHLGISMLVMDKPDMLASKLSALLTRKRFAMRDVFDVWFFMKNNWPINEKNLTEMTGLSLQESFDKAKNQVKTLKKTEVLAGLGELLDNKQKSWAREKLVDEVVFYLDLYSSELT